MAKESLDIPNNLRKVHRRFERWRSAHTGRLPIPQRLWRAATELAREHGIFHTAKVLHLEYGKLKRRVESAGPANAKVPAAKGRVAKARATGPRRARSNPLPLCGGCHSVNLDLHAYWTAGVEKVTEWNVGCERCHGPGSEHVKRPSADNIINPAQLDSVEANDICIQCHVQGRPRSSPIHGQYYDWPVGFHVGLRLRDFWQLEPHRLGVTNYYYYADGTAHKNRMQGNDFVQSLMYRHGVTCFDCHDVHGAKHRFELRRPVATMCLECHGPGSPNGPYTATIEEHTHHPPGNPGSRCVACHMPKIETELVPGAFAHAHTFRFVTPAMTEKYGIPNPCITCHKHKTNQWATSWLDRWYSPWRMDGAK